jgi:hypothetical protein
LLVPLPPRPPPGHDRPSAGPGGPGSAAEDGGLGPSGPSNGTRIGSGGLRRRTYTGGLSTSQSGAAGGTSTSAGTNSAGAAQGAAVQGASSNSSAAGGVSGGTTPGRGEGSSSPAAGVTSPTSHITPVGARITAAPPLLQPAWSPPASQLPPSSSVTSPSSERMPFRMSDLLARVEELNQLAGDGCGQLVPSKGAGAGGLQAHVLHTPEPVRLSVFKDGLQVRTVGNKHVLSNVPARSPVMSSCMAICCLPFASNTSTCLCCLS